MSPNSTPNSTPHWLRHAHATHALEHGHAPIHLVQATLGHASVATTSKYLHARPNRQLGAYLGVLSPTPPRPGAAPLQPDRRRPGSFKREQRFDVAAIASPSSPTSPEGRRRRPTPVRVER